MATYIRQVIDNAGNTVLPATRAEAVYFLDNSTLDTIMSSQAGVVNKALGDKNGNAIDTTYVKGLSASGRTVTVTKGDGSSTTFQTQDTTYSEATADAAGLMSSTDKKKLNGIAAGANNYTHPSYTEKASGLYKITVDNTGHVSAATAVAKTDITALGIPGQDTTYNAFTAASASSGGKTGLVPAPATGDQAKFLRGDATWATPANTTYNTFKAASSSEAGGTGLVPAPAAGAQNKYLRGDATWQTPPNTTYSEATTTVAGLMSSADKTKLDGIAPNANNYTHPSYTAKSSGLYKITVDATGHVSAVTAVAKSDITGLGIPAQDTTYSNATQSAAGLMSPTDKKKLDGVPEVTLTYSPDWGKTAADLPALSA